MENTKSVEIKKSKNWNNLPLSAKIAIVSLCILAAAESYTPTREKINNFIFGDNLTSEGSLLDTAKSTIDDDYYTSDRQTPYGSKKNEIDYTDRCSNKYDDSKKSDKNGTDNTNYVAADYKRVHRIGSASEDTCVVDKGAKLSVNNNRVTYLGRDDQVNPRTLGTECNIGTQFYLSDEEINADKKTTKLKDKAETVVLKQLNGMTLHKGVAAEPYDDWVTVMNSECTGANCKINIKFGDDCIAGGKIEKIGTLKTGQSVLRIASGGGTGMGTRCLTGTIFLKDGDKVL